MKNMEIKLMDIKDILKLEGEPGANAASDLFCMDNFDILAAHIRENKESFNDIYNYANWENMYFEYDLCGCYSVEFIGKLYTLELLDQIRDQKLLPEKTIRRLEWLNNDGLDINILGGRVNIDYYTCMEDCSNSHLLEEAVEDLEKVARDIVEDMEYKVKLWIDSDVEAFQDLEYITDLMSVNDWYFSRINGKLTIIYNVEEIAI